MQFRSAAIRMKAQKDMKGEKKVRLCRLRAQGDNQETKEEK